MLNPRQRGGKVPPRFTRQGLFCFIFIVMKDNFSKQAALYAQYRPVYPAALFEFILGRVEEKRTAWDCATGNGQTAQQLAPHFETVHATDISQQQLDHAGQVSNIFYSLQPAEQTNFNDDQFDLVTVSQALHWFDFDKFYREVKRVTKPGGWIAVWMYGGLSISPEIDQLKQAYYSNTLGPYWDKERKYVDDNYAGILFPFAEISCPEFSIRDEWALGDFEGYLNTWSALQKFMVANGYNPVGELVQQVQPFWTNEKMPIRFPLYLRMGRVHK
jgi:ubiquinone/menaquinone biosynthesis C-methylase UbiE